MDRGSRESIGRRSVTSVLRFGGLDILVNTAAIFPAMDPAGGAPEDIWAKTLQINVTSNHVPRQTRRRGSCGSRGCWRRSCWTSSANAIVPKHGSEA